LSKRSSTFGFGSILSEPGSSERGRRDGNVRDASVGKCNKGDPEGN